MVNSCKTVTRWKIWRIAISESCYTLIETRYQNVCRIQPEARLIVYCAGIVDGNRMALNFFVDYQNAIETAIQTYQYFSAEKLNIEWAIKKCGSK